ncbi:MAG: VOC family protein [Betaproteobacteria bacterium]|jgi:catechol 2,3-dioxygenase-like lactoylglutathione lyase family enzyme|nr:VOC family protein [Polynucleobacter sp.]NBY64370.1 biphenyl 2,3-dioxygenase [Betaproteobacteria bacterium]
MPSKSPNKFAHIVYRTYQFEKMIHWYQTVLGAKVQHKDPVIAFVTYDEEHHRVAFLNMAIFDPEGSKTRVDRVGTDHVAYTYTSLRDLFENYDYLKGLGILPYWCLHHGVTVSLYYGDPDGNRSEFQVDVYATNEEANAFMNGPGFAQNPIGVEFDPDELVKRLRSGEPESNFLVRKEHLPIAPLRNPVLEI